MAARITTLTPLSRNQGIAIGDALPAASWCDSLVLAGAAESYTIKGTAPDRGVIIRICSTAVIYYNFNATAVVPTGDTTNGSSAVMLPADTPRILVFPLASETLSIIGTATVTIEAWK